MLFGDESRECAQSHSDVIFFFCIEFHIGLQIGFILCHHILAILFCSTNAMCDDIVDLCAPFECIWCQTLDGWNWSLMEDKSGPRSCAGINPKTLCCDVFAYELYLLPRPSIKTERYSTPRRYGIRFDHVDVATADAVVVVVGLAIRTARR